MTMTPDTRRFLEQEARALLARLDRMLPFSLIMPMVAAASLSPRAQRAMDTYLTDGRHAMRALVDAFIDWLLGKGGRTATASEAQRRLTYVRLRFHRSLTQFDIFADAITQRSEHGYGVWLAGLDALAEDALHTACRPLHPPPVLTYLDRGAGAAIRRARTRLPGGGENPVSLIRVPRERMIGAGIGSSLVHEVGHQVAAQLDLVRSLRVVLRARRADDPANAAAWLCWERWISEIVADFWSVILLGVSAPVGLIGVVSLPRPFVFRMRLDDPHPFPWIRVKLCLAIGRALYPHGQWRQLALRWESLYPTDGLGAAKRAMLARLERHMPVFVALLLAHHPASLHGLALREMVALEQRRPERLAALFQGWRRDPHRIPAQAPTLVFAVLGQARNDGQLGAGTESRLIAQLLERWAVSRTAAGYRPIATSRPAVLGRGGHIASIA